MSEVDDAILEFLHALGRPGGAQVALPPRPIWYHLVNELETLDKSPATFSRRLKQLTERGLLEMRDENAAYYRISETGLAYLDGEITAEQLLLSEE
ncbi:helix-turn-helix domain-containing protein [Halorussus halophilus]|uniref:transcriptional regulator n=1 Tax=Halorussus halophilus TaxID=2650975 RepID=UPI001CE42A5C|nr:transcriptional regulator [Halorussus halophilus]